MRPFTVSLPAQILAITPVANGLAVLTEEGIELLAEDLSRIGSIPGKAKGSVLRQLADGRFLASSTERYGSLFVGSHQLEEVLPEHVWVDPPHLTPSGYVAVCNDGTKLLIDDGGATRWVDIESPGENLLAWRDRLILTSTDGAAVIDITGKRTAQCDLRFAKQLAIVGDRVVLQRSDERLRVLGIYGLGDAFSIDVETVDAVAAHGTNLVVLAGDVVTYWELGDVADERWSHEVEASKMFVIGDWIAVGSWKTATHLIDARSGAIHEVALVGLSSALPFGNGVALFGTAQVSWWRPDQPEVDLAHDVAAAHSAVVPFGLATSEDRHLYVWRPDADGPAYVPVATSLPMNVPIVVGGGIVHAREQRRFSVVAEANGHRFSIAPDAPWRPATDATCARAIVDRLLARAVDGELPPEASAGYTALAALAQRPLVETAPFVARSLFAASKLTPEQRNTAASARSAFFGELASALEMRPRVLTACVRARKFPLVPPHEVTGYDYLGSFTTSREVWVADPCYFNKRSSAKSVVIKLEVREGLWHAFVRNGERDAADRTAELVAIHSDGFSACAVEFVGSIGVDAGLAGVFDKQCPKIDLDHGVEEGIKAGLCVMASSGYGDGGYNTYAGRLGREIVKLRIGFLEDTERDRTVVLPNSGRTYSPKLRFAFGEAVDHPSFGAGTVTNVQDGKITVAFATGARTLVHAKS